MTEQNSDYSDVKQEDHKSKESDKMSKKMSGDTPTKRTGKRGRRPSKVDVKVKLERSRQSARECRARKKLRYQYLEELVNNREKAVFALRSELEQFKIWCDTIDKGNIPEELERLRGKLPVLANLQTEVLSQSHPSCSFDTNKVETPYDILIDVLGAPRETVTSATEKAVEVPSQQMESQNREQNTEKRTGAGSPWGEHDRRIKRAKRKVSKNAVGDG